MVRRSSFRRRNRRVSDRAVPSTPALAAVTSATAGSSAVTVVTNAPVMINADTLPTTWTFGGTNLRHITALTSATPTTLVFALSGTVTAAQSYAIGALDPAVRTTSGGYVGSSTGTLA